MTYDPKAKTITYSKENSDKQYELKCEPVPGEEMYFCCTLNTHDETVSIVQDVKLPKGQTQVLPPPIISNPTANAP